MYMYAEWVQATRGLKDAVCSITGKVATSAEAGPGVAEVLVAGPEGSGVRPHKASKRIEGGARSREAVTGVCWVSYSKLEG